MKCGILHLKSLIIPGLYKATKYESGLQEVFSKTIQYVPNRKGSGRTVWMCNLNIVFPDGIATKFIFRENILPPRWESSFTISTLQMALLNLSHLIRIYTIWHSVVNFTFAIMNLPYLRKYTLKSDSYRPLTLLNPGTVGTFGSVTW